MTERIDAPSDATAPERRRLLPDALRLGPVRLRVSDLRRSLDYYTQVLGLEARDVTATSAASPQVAGVCALLKQVQPGLSPDLVKAILKSSARDVRQGQSFHGQPYTFTASVIES